jgi:hypothetical protein
MLLSYEREPKAARVRRRATEASVGTLAMARGATTYAGTGKILVFGAYALTERPHDKKRYPHHLPR